MICPNCDNSATSCLDSRQRQDGSRHRRYGCVCGFRFSTRELVVADRVQKAAKPNPLTALLAESQRLSEGLARAIQGGRE